MDTSGDVAQVAERNIVFHCSAISEPVHITDWRFNSLPLTNSSKYLIEGQDSVNSTLTVFNVSLADEGSYTCRVSNVHGFDFESATLRVQGMISDPVEAKVDDDEVRFVNCGV